MGRDAKCFLLEDAGKIDRRLRRYRSSNVNECPRGTGFYHDASVPLDVVPDPDGVYRGDGDWPHDDPRWPKTCGCGYAFAETDRWQLFCERLYRRTDTGEEMRLRDAPPGAMWFADWMIEGRTDTNGIFIGPDGHCLVVKLPNGRDWMVDDRCSNCGLPNDNVHKCWVRHGTPPFITVDKNGLTCPAGAGSIASTGWHGFLTNGELREC